MNRFFVQKEAIDGNAAVITGEDVRHISKVLRMTPGDRLMLCDGVGYEYLSEVYCIVRDEVRLRVLAREECASEPKQRITLYQGLPKAGKMELIIQKCVELGVTEITPTAATRSVVRASVDDFKNKQVRYQKVAYEAAKQSGRGIIPRINCLTSFTDADMSAHDLIIIAYEGEKRQTLKEILRSNSNAEDIAVIIGPEGGLEKAEVEALEHKGGKAVTLGPRILRTETAGMAAIAMILYEIED